MDKNNIKKSIKEIGGNIVVPVIQGYLVAKLTEYILKKDPLKKFL